MEILAWAIRSAPGSVMSRDRTSSNRWQIVRCDEAQWRLFGLSLAGYNAIFSFAGAAMAVLMLRNRIRPRPYDTWTTAAASRVSRRPPASMP